MSCKINQQGLEGYSGDPGFGQNTVRDSGKCKYLDGIRELTATREAGFAKIWARDARLFFACLSGIREIVTTQGNAGSGPPPPFQTLNQFVSPFVRSFVRSFIRSLFLPSVVRSFVRPFPYSLAPWSFVHSLVHSLFLLFTRQFLCQGHPTTKF